jgi:(p)ppGpp synthase/HD superfamily hydrolase
MKVREKLADWVASKHAGQLIKRTGKPYFDHLLAVAEMAAPAVAFGYEIGLCHDLLEDTDTNEQELIAALISFGYTFSNTNIIASCVTELTDVFTRAAYPELSKLERKAREAERLMKISATAQTVKYCDLIYNMDWVLEFDQKHAEVYLIKKKLLLNAMVKGDAGLRQRALHAIDNGLKGAFIF